MLHKIVIIFSLLGLSLHSSIAENTQKTNELHTIADIGKPIVAENTLPNKKQTKTRDPRIKKSVKKTKKANPVQGQIEKTVRPEIRIEREKTQKKTPYPKSYQVFIEKNIGFTVTKLQTPAQTDMRQIFVNTETLLTNGFRFNSFLFLGAGTGLQLQIDDTWYYTAIPLFGNIRLYAPGPRHTPFIGSDVGYIFFPSKQIEGGLYCNIYVGIRIKLRHKMAINASGGYAQQRAEGITATHLTVKGPFHSGKLKLGFEF